MRVFLTGATGFIGSAIIPELLRNGHQVLGLARSDEGAKSLTAAGAKVHRGDVENLESLRSGAAQANAVMHLAFIHDFSKFQENCEIDRRAIEVLGDALVGTKKLLIVTSGTGISSAGTGVPTTESDPPVSLSTIPRAATEEAANAVAARGVKVAIVRLPQVHDTARQGLVSYAIQVARQKGRAAYVGEGRNRWAAVHVSDAARLYRLALEKDEGGVRYHAVGEEGVSARDIAEAIGHGLKIPVVSLTPEQGSAHFGWLAHFIAWDMPASSAKTRAKLGWNPSGPDLITDLRNMNYSS